MAVRSNSLRPYSKATSVPLAGEKRKGDRVLKGELKSNEGRLSTRAEAANSLRKIGRVY